MPAVRMPDGSIVELPDQATPEQLAEIERAANPNARPVTPKEALRQLLLGGRHLAQGATNTMQQGSDAIVSGMNKAFGSNIPPTSQTVSGLWDKLVKPETPLEKNVQTLTEMGGGMMDPVFGAAQKLTPSAPAGFAGNPSSQQRTSKELHDAGLKLMPEQTGGGLFERFLQGVGGEQRLNTSLRDMNQSKLQEQVAKATGVNARNLTDEAFAEANRRIYKQTYEPVMQALPHVPRGGQVQRQELAQILQKNTGIRNYGDLERAVTDVYRPMPTHEALEKIRRIRRDAKDAIRRNESSLGMALRKVADSVEDQIERNLPATHADLIDTFKAGRTAIAKNDAAREMLVDKSTGIIDVNKAYKLEQEGMKLTDGLDTVAKAGSPMYRASTSPPVRGEGVPINWGDIWRGGAGSGIGFMFSGGNPIGAAAGAIAAPVVSGGARRMLTTDAMQNAMARKLIPHEPGMLDELGRRAGYSMFGNMDWPEY